MMKTPPLQRSRKKRIVPNRYGVKIMSQEIKTFQSASAFRNWLAKHHGGTDGVWVRIFKKSSGEKSLTRAEAVDEALCYGWIDGQAKSYDNQSWVQRFSPRRPSSGWSKINTQRVEHLIKAGRAETRRGGKSRRTLERRLRFPTKCFASGRLALRTRERQDGESLFRHPQ
jgi:hypothetical protein